MLPVAGRCLQDEKFWFSLDISWVATGQRPKTLGLYVEWPFAGRSSGDGLPNAIRRYSRVQLCATTFGCATHLNMRYCRTLARHNVAQIFNLLYRRVVLGWAFATRTAFAFCQALGCSTARRLQICDTAECNS
ncbi:MAG TPA: hypothetical protein VF988_15960, partial [Verrucomicrobiae bacterium]